MRSIHERHFAGINLARAHVFAGRHPLVSEAIIIIEDCACIGNHLCSFLGGIEVDDLVCHHTVLYP